MSDDMVWHIEKSRSWWDGSATTWCGVSYDNRKNKYRESWFTSGPSTCRGCQAAQAAAGK